MLAVVAIALSPIEFRREFIAPGPGIDFTGMFNQLQGLTHSLDAAQIKALSSHIGFVWIATLFSVMVLAGDGLHAIDRFNSAGSTSNLRSSALFTLSLPISRRAVAMTRLGAAYFAAVAILAGCTAANALVLLALHRTVPIGPMLFASAFASVIALFWMCATNILVIMLGAPWGAAFGAVAMLFSAIAAIPGMSAAAALQLQWAVLVVIAVVVAGAMWLSTAMAALEDH